MPRAFLVNNQKKKQRTSAPYRTQTDRTGVCSSSGPSLLTMAGVSAVPEDPDRSLAATAKWVRDTSYPHLLHASHPAAAGLDPGFRASENSAFVRVARGSTAQEAGEVRGRGSASPPSAPGLKDLSPPALRLQREPGEIIHSPLAADPGRGVTSRPFAHLSHPAAGIPGLEHLGPPPPPPGLQGYMGAFPAYLPPGLLPPSHRPLDLDPAMKMDFLGYRDPRVSITNYWLSQSRALLHHPGGHHHPASLYPGPAAHSATAAAAAIDLYYRHLYPAGTAPLPQVSRQPSPLQSELRDDTVSSGRLSPAAKRRKSKRNRSSEAHRDSTEETGKKLSETIICSPADSTEMAAAGNERREGLSSPVRCSGSREEQEDDEEEEEEDLEEEEEEVEEEEVRRHGNREDVDFHEEEHREDEESRREDEGGKSPHEGFSPFSPSSSTVPLGFPSPFLPGLYPGSLHGALGGASGLLPGASPAGLLGMGLGGGRRPRDPNKPPPVKKYKCDLCGKAFSRSNTLVTHRRIHTGEKPFKCEVCGRAFRQPGNLTRHRLTHTTVKPYVCPVCKKAFNRASNLHTHMRTHTNFKPFICPYCGKGFHQKVDMKIHCYTHTGRPSV